MVKFSIILAAYNVADYLDQCIESLRNQDFSHSDYEVLLGHL